MLHMQWLSLLLALWALWPSHAVAHKALENESLSTTRICILTFFTADDNSQSLKAMSWPNFEAYASRWQYDLIDALDGSRPALMSLYDAYQHSARYPGHTHHFKMIALHALLPNYDWIYWADGDSLFLNHSIPLSRYTDESEYDAIFSVNPAEEPAWSLMVNAGHYLIRNCEWSLGFAEEVIRWSMADCRQTLDMIPPEARDSVFDVRTLLNGSFIAPSSPLLNSWIHLCGSEDGRYWLADQGVLMTLFLYKPEDYRCHIQFVGFREFNSEYPWYEEGDLMVHFPGKGPAERASLMTSFNDYMHKETGQLAWPTEALAKARAPVVNPSNQKGMYHSFYKRMNVPCSAWKAKVHEWNNFPALFSI